MKEPQMIHEIHLINEEISKTDRIIVIPHILPDGDCIGSAAALAMVLESLGKEVVIGCDTPFPSKYDFMTVSLKFVHEDNNAPLIISVDCSDFDRMSLKIADLNNRKIINIDHHTTNPGFGHINWINTHASATGEMIYHIAKALNVKMEFPLIQNLYTAIMTDTGSFRFSNTTPETFRIIAELMEGGIKPHLIYERIYTRSIDSINLLTIALGQLEILANKKIGYSYISHEQSISLKVEKEDFDGIINNIKEIEGISIAVFFKELEKNKILNQSSRIT